MNKNTYLSLTGVVFALIALLHLARIIYGWEAMIGGWAVPMGLSWLALVVAGYLSWNAFSLRGR